jgi:hypothetical protein
MLSNQIYKGVTYYGRTKTVTENGKTRVDERPESEWILIPDATPAIVTDVEFDEAQKALMGPAQRNTAAPMKYLLRRHIFCGYCGGPLTGTILSRRYRYYQCTNARRIANRPIKCKARYVKADPLEESVWDSVKSVLVDPSVVLSEVRERQEENIPFGVDELKRVERDLADFDKQERNMLRQLRHGKFQESLVLEEIEDIGSHRARLELRKSEIEQHRRVIEGLRNAELKEDDVLRTVRRNLDSLDHQQKQLALRALGVRVVATPETGTLYGEIPSYVTIERRSASPRGRSCRCRRA